MPEIEEFRYPFNSAIEFFAGGYWHDILALHLIIAYISVSILAAVVLTRRRNMGQKLLALYFSLTLFNNFCFQIGGASLGDMAGIIAVFFLGLEVLKDPARTFEVPLSARFILGCAALFSIHACLIAAAYPVLNVKSDGIVRMAVILKIVVLGLCIILLRTSFRRSSDIDWLVGQIVNFATIGLLCYFIQIGLLLTGHVPYGTYLDAGFVGVPSFGSVSIERGHLGKFLTPLFPFFLLALTRRQRKWQFFLFIVVTLVNFSASSLSYFACYLACSIWLFRRKLLQARGFFWVGVAVAGLIAFAIGFHGVLQGVVVKVVDLAFKGEGPGGRGVGVLVDYVGRYPWGTSYGGSSLRIAPGMAEINSGIFAFYSQLSVLSIPVACCFAFLIWKVSRESKRIKVPYFQRCLATGVLIMPIIFSADLLWFVPTIWLPLILSEYLSVKEKSTPICVEDAACATA